jgi:hypothetical protein
MEPGDLATITQDLSFVDGFRDPVRVFPPSCFAAQDDVLFVVAATFGEEHTTHRGASRTLAFCLVAGKIAWFPGAYLVRVRT